jgi:hypothetical protein
MFLFRRLIFFSCVLCFVDTYAQNEKKIVIGINPFAPIGITNVPRVEIFFEKHFTRSSIAIDLGLGNFMGQYDSSVLKNNGYRAAFTYKNYEISSLLKRCLVFDSDKDEFYIGINLFHWYQQGSQLFSGKKSDSVTKLNDLYGMKRNAYGANIILGYQVLLVPFLSLDIYAGFGYKILDIKNTDREYHPENGDYSTRIDCGIFPCIGTLEEESYNRVNGALGVRLGCLIHKKPKQDKE